NVGLGGLRQSSGGARRRRFSSHFGQRGRTSATQRLTSRHVRRERGGTAYRRSAGAVARPGLARRALGRTGYWLRQPGTLSNISSAAAAAERNVTFELDRPPNLRQTLGYPRMGAGDPCFRIIGGSVWRS